MIPALSPLATMNAFPSFALLVAVKAALLLGLVAGVTVVLRQRSASVRHLLWSLGIAGTVALPAVAALTPLSLPLLPARPVASADVTAEETGPAPSPDKDATTAYKDAATASAAASAPVGAVSPTTVAPSEPAAATAATAWPFDAAAILLAAWAAGAALMLARFLIALRRVRGIVRRAAPMNDAQWLAIADRAHADPSARAFDLRVSGEVAMPFATGFIVPTIVLPESSLAWSTDRREAVLHHEIAHLSHGDLLMNALSHVARALHWFNPLAWYAFHRLRIEAERACDDAVLRRGARASDYADHLLTIASGAGAPLPTAALAMARPSAFEGRLLAILEPGLDRGALSRVRSLALVATFALVILPIAAASPTARVAAMTAGQQPAAEPAPRRAETSATQRATTTRVATQGEAQEPARGSGAVPVLIDALADGSAAVRLAAVNSLGQLEDPRAIAALGKALKEDSDPRVRQAAAHALGEIDDPRAVPHLLDALKTERVAEVKEQIVQALAEIDDPSAVAGIAALARDASVAVRRAVVHALGELEDQSAVSTIVSMASDADVEVRRYVADALGDLENASALDALTTLAKDKDAEVRASAVNALGQLEDARTLGTLVAALEDENREVRSQAADAIHNIPDIKTAPKPLIDALADADHDVRRNVAQALGSIGDDAAVPGLKKALGDNNADVRRTVAEALSEIGGPEAITALMGLLKDPDPEIRRIAAEALGKRR